MRLCIVGNSHLAALKLAIQEGLFDPQNFDITFWGLAGRAFETIRYDAGCFITPHQESVLEVSDGRYDKLPATEFDAVIFYGAALELARVLASLHRAGSGLHSYSDALLREGLERWIGTGPAYALARSLRADYEGRVLMCGLPFRSEESRSLAAVSMSPQDLSRLNALVSDILSANHLEYVAQPLTTVVENKYTKKEYSWKSTRLYKDLSVRHPENDYGHMNEHYGAHVMAEISERLLKPR